jgi:hypothetical protein
MNVEIGTEAAQFAEKEYINGIFLAVWAQNSHFLQAGTGPGQFSLPIQEVASAVERAQATPHPIYVFPEKKLPGLSPNFRIHISCERFIYSQDRHTYFPAVE